MCAMELKILKKTDSNYDQGISIIEVLVVITMVALLSTLAFVLINPQELKAKARDEKRLSDISTLERVISEFRVDNGYLPDELGVIRTSTSLPTGALGPLVQSNGNGWIPVNLSVYNSLLPIDPINNETYHYSYSNNGYSFELNARLEILTEHAQDDGGNDGTLYEVGDDLSII